MQDQYATAVSGERTMRPLIRTKDVYQTNSDNGIAGYSDKLLAVAAHFTNSGAPEGFNAQSMAGKTKKSELSVRLFARINPKTNVIERVGFKVRGNLAMIASASMICTLIEGKTLEEALEVKPTDLAEKLGGYPEGRGMVAIIAVEAVRALVGDWLIRQGATLAQLDQELPCDPYSTGCLIVEHCSLRAARTDLLVEEAMAAGRKDSEA